MYALVDSDIVVYRIGFTTEDVDAAIASIRTKELVDQILAEVDATSYKLFLTEENDPSAFRRQIYPEYKAHRIKPKPKWYQEIRAFLQLEYDAEVCTEIEADDALGIEQTAHAVVYHSMVLEGQQEGCSPSIICSIDKDLKQIRGHHYNFVKKELTYISQEEALYNFYSQLLIGDSSDNIKGVWKCGPVKAAKILEGTNTEQEMFNRVRETYNNDIEMLMNGRILWIWKQPNDDWKQYWDRLTAA